MMVKLNILDLWEEEENKIMLREKKSRDQKRQYVSGKNCFMQYSVYIILGNFIFKPREMEKNIFLSYADLILINMKTVFQQCLQLFLTA